ncbi:hypothetical protein SAMN05216350_102416 [Polaromonas sp. YR568]|nr:hypothetical protein [Polaromonas sp. YR568]SFU53407.1 hypothetical protein SAMN05216350_102416 [Polaromonas sp. YR568]
MQSICPSWKVRLLTLPIIIAVAAWFFVKPVRVILPEAAGVSCLSASVCVDDAARFREANELYAEGLAFVTPLLESIHGRPRVIFCASRACADSFGLGARSAVTLATFGTVIGPGAWKPYYVRHELIHYLQAERLGTLGLLFKPEWFVEGMAYGLSQDPRAPLAEPFESHRRRFLAWHAALVKQTVWQAAEGL